MSLTFHAAVWLVGLLPILGIAAGGLYAARRCSWRWRGVCVILPSLAALLLTLALAEPVWTHQPLAERIVVLLDLSPSARTSPWQRPAWLRTFLAEHLHATTRVSVVAFAGEARQVLGDITVADPWPREWPLRVEGQATLQEALAWRSAPGDHRPRWVITDGLLDLAPLAQHRDDFAVALTVVAVEPTDVGIADFQFRGAPLSATTAAATVGVRAEIWARLQATGPAQRRVEFLRDGQVLANLPVVFTGPGAKVLAATDALRPEPATRYDIRLSGGDPWPEDDAAALLAPPLGPPSILLVTSATEALRQALPAGKVQIVSPAQFPTDLGELFSRQIILLHETPLAALPAGSEEVLSKFVTATGGGLLTVGSSEAVGPGFYAGGSGTLAKILPLRATPPHGGPRRVIFLLDASGSMGEALGPEQPERKFSFAARGTLQALQALRADDEATVLTFNTQLGQVAAGSVGTISPTLNSRLAAVRPNGGTEPDVALDTLQRDVVEPTLIVVLTDGQIPRMDAPRWSKLLTDTHSQLAIVAPKQSGDALTQVAQAVGAAWLTADSPAQWNSLLRRAVDEEFAGKVHSDPVNWNAASLGNGSTRHWIEAWAQTGATIVATGGDAQRAFAAEWPQGLGRVGALAFHDDTPAFAALLGQMLQDLAPPVGDRRFAVAAQRRDQRWWITAEGRDEKGFRNGERLVLHMIPAEAAPALDLEVPQTAPGRYEVTLPAEVQMFSAVLTRQTATGAELVARLAPPMLPTSEWPALATPGEPPAGLLQIPATDHRTRWEPRLVARVQDLRPILWLAAVAVLLSALWLRRGSRV